MVIASSATIRRMRQLGVAGSATLLAYSPDEPRDAAGKWTSGGLDLAMQMNGWKKAAAKAVGIRVYKHPQFGKIRVYTQGAKAGNFHHMRPSAVHEAGRIAGKAKNLPDYVRKLSVEGLPIREKPIGSPAQAPGDQMKIPFVENPYPRGGAVEAEQKMSQPVSSKKELGGGINPSYKVVLADGTKAVWKPAPQRPQWGPEKLDTPEQERAAWQVAKLVGMTDLVPPTVIRTIDGHRGALIAWADGTPAVELPKDKIFDGDKDLTRAAAFDYVTGNVDRHDGNWIIGDGGSIHLIDHGRSFTDHPPSSRLLREARYRDTGMLSPSTLAEPYVKAKSQIRSELTKLGISGRSIDLAMARIDKLAVAKTWEDTL